jgi:microcystin-dependent protein
VSAPFVGEIRIFPYNFPPRGWAFCNGQIIPVSQNTALFAILGTFYGGNGTSNFALPNFIGRVPVHQGQGPGLSQYVIGEIGGSSTVTLPTQQIPSHAHNLLAFTGRGVTAHANPASGDALTASQGGSAYSPSAPDTQLSPVSVGQTGGSQPHDNAMPTLSLNFCIALQGIFPARN